MEIFKLKNTWKWFLNVFMKKHVDVIAGWQIKQIRNK